MRTRFINLVLSSRASQGHIDGSPLVTVHTKGRSFDVSDIDTLQASSDSGNFPEHPTITDELIALDRVLNAEEIEQYCTATRSLQQIQFSPLIFPAEIKKK